MSDFWIKATKDKFLRSEKTEEELWQEVLKIYEETNRRIENEVTAIIAKYGNDNKLTKEQALQLLKGKEYRSWKKRLEQYVQDVKNVPEDSKMLLELNTLSVKARVSKKEMMMAQINEAMLDLADQYNTVVTEGLGNIYEVNYYQEAFMIQKGMKVGFPIAKLDQERIIDVLTYPWNTKNFSKKIWEDVEIMSQYLKEELAIGLNKGSGIQKMTKIIKDRFQKSTKIAERLVRTEAKFFNTRGQLNSYEDLGIERYVFHGQPEGDHTHCECGHLNGKDFAIAEAEPYVNCPPLHPNCKCYITAKVKVSMFGNTGITPLSQNENFEKWKKIYVK